MHSHPHVNLSRYRTVRAIVGVWLTGVVLAAFLLDIPKINIASVLVGRRFSQRG